MEKPLKELPWNQQTAHTLYRMFMRIKLPGANLVQRLLNTFIIGCFCPLRL